MKRKITTLLSSTIIMVLIITACNKSIGSSSSISPEKITGKYAITRLAKRTEGSLSEVYGSTKECTRENQQELKADMTYNMVGDGKACSFLPANSGIWNVSGNTLTLDGDTYTIETLTDRKLVLTKTEVVQGKNNEVSVTFSRLP